MTKEEIKEYIKDNLKINIYKKYVDYKVIQIKVELTLEYEVVSEEFIEIDQ